MAQQPTGAEAWQVSRGEHLTGFMCAAVIDLGVLVNTGSMGAILVEVWAEIGGASQPSGWLYAAQAACRVTSAPKGRQIAFYEVTTLKGQGHPLPARYRV